MTLVVLRGRWTYNPTANPEMGAWKTCVRVRFCALQPTGKPASARMAYSAGRCSPIKKWRLLHLQYIRWVPTNCQAKHSSCLTEERGGAIASIHL
jgi:hypothetical protein